MDYNLQISQMTYEDFNAFALPSFLQVFNLPCPFVAPFTPAMVERMVLYCGVYLHSELLDPIIKVATNIGDKGFYFSFVEDYNYEIWYPGLSGKELYLNTWFIPFDKFQYYMDQIFLTSHVIYSPQGKWGAYISNEDFVLIVGIGGFVNELKHLIPNHYELTHKFIEDRKYMHLSLNPTFELIPKLMNHVYGFEETKRLLNYHGITDSFMV